MIYLSYYTSGDYEKVINENLLPTLDRFDLNYEIINAPDLGSWHLNTDLKPTIIKNALEQFEHDIIFVDADAEIVQYPGLFEGIPEEYDIAVHYLDWGKFWRNTPNSHGYELLTGTMMMRYNDKVLNLLDKYIKECEKDATTVEQKILQRLLEQDKTGLKVFDLPVEYCTIIKQNGTIPSYIGDPVIIHNQASRKYKRRTGEK